MPGAGPIVQRTMNQRQYVSQLRMAYHGVRLWSPDVALAEDPFYWEKMLRDPHIRMTVDGYKRAVGGREWTMEPGDDTDEASQLAGIADDALRKVKRFAEARQGLCLARFHGRSYRYINFVKRTLNLSGTGKMPWAVPIFLEDVDYRGIEFVPVREDGVLSLQVEVRDLNSANFRRMRPCDLAVLIPHIYGDEEGRVNHGRGVGEAMYFFFFLKGKVLEEGMQWLERWAQGLVIGKVDAEAMGNKDQSAATVASNMMNKLEKHRSRGIFVTDIRDDVQAMFPSGTGAGVIWDKAIPYFDKKISGLVGSPIRPSGQDSGSTGARAQAETEMDFAEGQWQGDRDLLEETLTEHLVLPFVRQNRATLRALGLHQAAAPRFSLAAEQREDPTESVTVIQTALSAGITLDSDEVYRKIGMTKPRTKANGEFEGDVIRGQAPQPAGLGSPFAFDPMPEDAIPPTDGEQPVEPHETAADGDTVVGSESIAAQGVEPPSMQEVSLAYERSIKNGDRATANLMRKKLWAITGEETAPDISDEEWAAMTTAGDGGGGGVEPEPPAFPEKPAAFADRPFDESKVKRDKGEFAKQEGAGKSEGEQRPDPSPTSGTVDAQGLKTGIGAAAASPEYVESLTEEERAVADWYTEDGWVKLNASLRGTEDVRGDPPRPQEEFEEAAVVLDSMIAKAGTSETPWKSYRGIRVDDPEAFVRSIEESGEFTDPAFQSTSTEARIASNTGNVVLVFKTSEGAPMGGVSENNQSENELLLGRGWKFKPTTEAQELTSRGKKLWVIGLEKQSDPEPASFADRDFDESKVKRDKGEFAKTEGASGESDPSGGGGSTLTRDLPTTPGLDLTDHIDDTGIVMDGISTLWEDDAESSMAQDFDLNTVRFGDVVKAREFYAAKSQAALKAKGVVGDDGFLTVYRGASEGQELPTSETTSTTLDKFAARDFAAKRAGQGRDATITEYKVHIDDVKGYSEAVSKGTFAEEEVLIGTQSMEDPDRRVSQTRIDSGGSEVRARTSPAKPSGAK